MAGASARSPAGPAAEGRRSWPPAAGGPGQQLLKGWWSPEQISRRLRIEYPGDPMMWVSHETIYQALYVQGRGELRRELARCLRTGRARRARAAGENTGRIRDMVMIASGPPRPPTGRCPATGKAT